MKRIVLIAAVGAAGALVVPAADRAASAQQMVDGPAVTWNMSVWGKRRAFTEGGETLIELLKERTGGKFRITMHYGEALSKAREHLDGIKIGAFQAGYFCNFYHPGKNPAHMVFSLPFLPLGDWNVSLDVRKRLFEHPALVKDMDQWNAMHYTTTLLPQYEFLGKNPPPLKLEDWKGRRVRAGGGLGDAMRVLGATPETPPAPEVYTGMERGTFSAASFPYTYSHVAYRIHEVSDWFTTNMSPGTSECPMVFSKTAYAKLPDQYKKLLDELKPAVDKRQIEAYVEIDNKNLPMLHSKLKPITYSDEQLAEFRKVAGQPVWDAWVKEYSEKYKFDAQDVLDKLFQYAKEAGAKQKS